MKIKKLKAASAKMPKGWAAGYLPPHGIDPPYWWNYTPHAYEGGIILIDEQDKLSPKLKKLVGKAALASKPGRGKTKALKKPKKKPLKGKLRKAMLLPFDQAMPIIRKAICKNYELAFDDEISKWCARHTTEISATLKSER